MKITTATIIAAVLMIGCRVTEPRKSAPIEFSMPMENQVGLTVARQDLTTKTIHLGPDYIEYGSHRTDLDVMKAKLSELPVTTRIVVLTDKSTPMISLAEVLDFLEKSGFLDVVIETKHLESSRH